MYKQKKYTFKVGQVIACRSKEGSLMKMKVVAIDPMKGFQVEYLQEPFYKGHTWFGHELDRMDNEKETPSQQQRSEADQKGQNVPVA